MSGKLAKFMASSIGATQIVFSYAKIIYGIWAAEMPNPNYLWHPKLIVASQIIYGILIFSYEKYMAKYEEENMNRIPWILKPNEKEIILIMHDECIF